MLRPPASKGEALQRALAILQNPATTNYNEVKELIRPWLAPALVKAIVIMLSEVGDDWEPLSVDSITIRQITSFLRDELAAR